MISAMFTWNKASVLDFYSQPTNHVLEMRDPTWIITTHNLPALTSELGSFEDVYESLSCDMFQDTWT